MTPRLQRILLVSGRELRENPYRELIIKTLLERQGIQVRYVIPGGALNKSTSIDTIPEDPVLRQAGALLVSTEAQFRHAMRDCQLVVFSTWRSYITLTRLAQAEGRPTINFCATSGIDHWTHGVERCLIRSPFTHRLLRFEHETMGLPLPPADQIRIVGSIQYTFPENHQPVSFPDRERFCHHYGLDPQRPIAVLFPKGIQLFHKKIALWFKQWNQTQVDAYNQWFLDRYARICQEAQKARCNLLIKLHPAAYAGYLCDSDEEFRYWNRYPWVRILQPEHTMAMFRFADVGLGINSHSALDMGYFNKPFVYVDSDLVSPPELPSFQSIHLSDLPPGPSSHWHTDPTRINPWFHTWLGGFSRVEELAGVLDDPVRALPIDPVDRQAFITEFWGMDDDRAAERIVAEILAFGEETLSSWSRQLSWPRWRGRIADGLHRLRPAPE
ncbi:MAG: hypothetical protein HQM00_04825 [Magnetococcales bacterium]|nr:hypothetical protein [Magnetococcales bacterium]